MNTVKLDKEAISTLLAGLNDAHKRESGEIELKIKEHLEWYNDVKASVRATNNYWFNEVGIEKLVRDAYIKSNKWPSMIWASFGDVIEGILSKYFETGFMAVTHPFPRRKPHLMRPCNYTRNAIGIYYNESDRLEQPTVKRACVYYLDMPSQYRPNKLRLDAIDFALNEVEVMARKGEAVACCRWLHEVEALILIKEEKENK